MRSLIANMLVPFMINKSNQTLFAHQVKALLKKPSRTSRLVGKLEVPIRKKRRGGNMQKEGGNKGKVEIDKSFFLKATLATLLFMTCSFSQSHCHPSSRVNTNVGAG
jgi:hypothetical protein